MKSSLFDIIHMEKVEEEITYTSMDGGGRKTSTMEPMINFPRPDERSAPFERDDRMIGNIWGELSCN